MGPRAEAGPLGAAGGVPLVAGVRSGFPETLHTGAAVVLAPDGSVRRALGDVDALVYPRSALKPFQTVAAVRAGARFDDEQLVVVTSSHVGAPRHVAVVRGVLASAGLGDDALLTPAAWPSSAEAARALAITGGSAAPVYMNCSGNHAGMLAGSVAAGWSTGDYLRPDHPIHAEAAAVIADATGALPSARGIDGCGGPVWALPLAALARGLQRVMGDDPRLAAAIRRHPDLIQGAGTPTSRAVEALGVAAKSGAEGVWTAVAADGTTVAVKVLGGSGTAAAIAGIALLRDSGSVDAPRAEALLAEVGALTGGGRPVGALVPA